MMMTLPTRRTEAWRYSDFKALQSVWPLRSRDAEPVDTRIFDNGTSHEINFAAGRTHVVVQVPDEANVTLVQTLSGTGSIYAQIDIVLGTSATLTHVIRQCAAPAAVVLTEISVHAKAGALYDASLLAMGGDYVRTAFDIVIAEPAARVDLRAVQLVGGIHTIELVTALHHQAAGGSSRQIIRTVAADQSTGSYLGKIVVAPGAQKTNAAQSAKALLLARTATANIKPELEIRADDVKCAHGATVGEMDAQALFYMASRGISSAQARTLLIEAFVADALAPEDVEAQGLVADWLGQHFSGGA